MKTQNILLLTLLISSFSPIFAEETNSILQDVEKVFNNKKSDRINNRKQYKPLDLYQEFKNDLEKYGLSYSVDFTYMPQRGSPNGNKTPQQFMIAPNVDWTVFSNNKYGSLDVQFAYTTIAYWGEQGEMLQNKLNIGTGINDYTNKGNQFSQMLLSYTLPGEMNWLSLNVGQYSLYFINTIAIIKPNAIKVILKNLKISFV